MSKEQEQARLRAKIAKCQLMIDSLSHKSYFIEEEEGLSHRRNSRRSTRGEKGERRRRRSTRHYPSVRNRNIPESMKVQVNDSTNGLGLSMMTDEDIDIALKMLSTHSQIEQHLREENELLKRELESRQQGSSAGTSFESSKEAIESEASERSQAKKKTVTDFSDSSSCSSYGSSASSSSTPVSEGSVSSEDGSERNKSVGGVGSQLNAFASAHNSPKLGIM